MQVKFFNFQLEEIYDWVFIFSHDPSTGVWNRLHFFDGNSLPPGNYEASSVDQDLWLFFKTDYTIGYSGFALIYDLL